MSTINIPFKLVSGEDGRHPGMHRSYIDHALISLSGNFSESKARVVFREALQKQIEQGLRALLHYEQKYLGSRNGEIFHVYWSPISDGWCYDIVGPHRKGASLTIGYKTFEEVLSAARRHVDSSYGGIVWEC